MQLIPEADLHFVILCPERNWGGLIGTSKSIKDAFPNSHSIAIVGDDATDAELKEFNAEVKTVRGGKTVSGLMNTGLKHSKKNQWNFVFVAGNYIRYRILKKYFRFVDTEKDIIYPVIDRCWTFYDASINGILMHNSIFDAVGDFDEGIENFSNIKLLWALDAIKAGAKFKAVVGTRL